MRARTAKARRASVNMVTGISVFGLVLTKAVCKVSANNGMPSRVDGLGKHGRNEM